MESRTPDEMDGLEAEGRASGVCEFTVRILGKGGQGWSDGSKGNQDADITVEGKSGRLAIQQQRTKPTGILVAPRGFDLRSRR